MLPVVTPEEMAAIDRAAPEPVDVLIGRAGAAVARSAVDLLGGTYGRRVVVIEGKGNNGNDGRDAARRLRARGIGVVEIDATTAAAMGAAGESLPGADLVIDAAFGTGFRGTWAAPAVHADALVLAVDIPSGVDGLTGDIARDSRVLRADRTVTFAARKPGLVLAPGSDTAGEVVVADIGLDVSGARSHVVTADDVGAWLPARPTGAHKWQTAVWVVAGSAGMEGAAALVCAGAQRTGAGYVRVSSPGIEGPLPGVPTEAVHSRLPVAGWAPVVAAGLDRFRAVAIGNGLGTGDATSAEIREVVAAASAADLSTVIDADALTALAGDPPPTLSARAVLTPHDGEYERLMGSRPGADRLLSARELSVRYGCVALLKGSTTVVAAPDGRVLLATAGDSRLATAGTGDVLAGVVAALCARGVTPFEAAAAGAFIHGSAGALGWPQGFVAGDLAALLPAVLSTLPASAALNP